jgi:hypothetical protein
MQEKNDNREDPIVEEVRKIREEIMEQAGSFED